MVPQDLFHHPTIDHSIQLDMYGNVIGHSVLIDRLFTQLRKKLIDELRFLKEVTQVKGALDMVLTSSQLTTSQLDNPVYVEGQ
jgi:hypothetical protein